VNRFLILGIFGMLIASAAVPLVGQTPEAPSAQATPQGNIEKGKESFKVHGCVSCHGFSAWGGAGARLAQNPITFQTFVAYVRKPKATMPAFGAQVTASELADIYAFIKSIPPSPDPRSIPLLNEKD
jgi:mono/diheme cytochrome c family protein